MSKKWRLPGMVIYALLAFGVLRQAWGLIQTIGPDQGFPHVKTMKVVVSGDVRRPGVYRVPQGATQFELLQAAGIRPTSDLSNINLLATAGAGDLDVPVRDQAVGIASAQVAPRIESQSGIVSVIARDGTHRSGLEGAYVNAGDTIRTLGAAKMELSVGSRSRLSLEEFSHLALDTVRFADGKATGVKLTQRNGTGWYRVGLDEGSYWHVTTPSATLAATGTGGEFLVEVQIDRVSISCTNGNCTVEKTGGGGKVNLIAGQAAIVYTDNRPLQLSRISADLSSSHPFTPAAPSAGVAATSQNDQQLNILFCGTPYLYLVVRFQPGKDVVSIVHVPPQLQVSQFAQGVSTLDQAYLYGGPSFVASILERLLNTRLTKYCAVSKASVLQIAEGLGGLKIDNGTKMSGSELIQYLTPSNSSPEQSLLRQQQVFNAIFDNIKSNKFAITLPVLQQMLSAMTTNIEAKELMDSYLGVAAKGNLTRRDIKLPVVETRQNGKTVSQPNFDQCRALFND